MKKFMLYLVAVCTSLIAAVPAFAVDTTIPDMFLLVDLSGVKTGQIAMYAILPLAQDLN
jgi:hypothetical protein